MLGEPNIFTPSLSDEYLKTNCEFYIKLHHYFVGDGDAKSGTESIKGIRSLITKLLLTMILSKLNETYMKILLKMLPESMDNLNRYKPKPIGYSAGTNTISTAVSSITSDKELSLKKYMLDEMVNNMLNGGKNNTYTMDELQTILSLKREYPYPVFPGKIHFNLGTELSSNKKNGISINHRLIFCPADVPKGLVSLLAATGIDYANTNLQDNDRKFILLMPEYSIKNEDNISQLLPFLLHSSNQKFSIDLATDLELKLGQYYSLISTIKHENNVKLKFTLRLNVVTPQMFEEAMRSAQLFTLELAYSNIFPSDCRMFICLPVYKGGYINTKDRKDRGLDL